MLQSSQIKIINFIVNMNKCLNFLSEIVSTFKMTALLHLNTAFLPVVSMIYTYFCKDVFLILIGY